MPNIASVLKLEIARIARKEVRAQTLGLKKIVTAGRSEIAALKRRSAKLEQEVRRFRRRAGSDRSAADAGQSPKAPRFSAKSLASQRRRLQLSAQDCGLLIGASSQSVYNWEQGKARPQERHIRAIAALRSLGKREAAANLELLRKAA